MATLDSVVVYGTESLLPLAVLGHLHYDSITDLAWSSDGRLLAVSSRDCYCRWARGSRRGGAKSAHPGLCIQPGLVTAGLQQNSASAAWQGGARPTPLGAAGAWPLSC